MKNIKLAAPWIQYASAVKALFERDEDIKFFYDEDKVEIKLLVSNADKANALAELLPEEKVFGNVTLYINIVPANYTKPKSVLFKELFEGNPIFKDAIDVQMQSNPLTYIVFEKEVVQYYNDNLQDPYGLRSTLYQILADEVFPEHEGVFFCTDKNNDNLVNWFKNNMEKNQATAEEVKLWEKYNGKGSFYDGSVLFKKGDIKNTKE